MLDRPQIISPENHPQDCVVFVKRANTVGGFLREADKLVLSGEHRIICWHPPHGESIVNKLSLQSDEDAFESRELRIEERRFHREINVHFDETYAPSNLELILNGFNCNLTQTLEQKDSRESIGTNLFFLPLNHPRRKNFYDRVLAAYEISGLESLRAHGVAEGLRGPFSLAAGNVALLLSKKFKMQATLHGLPVYQTPEKSDVRNTLIAGVWPTEMR